MKKTVIIALISAIILAVNASAAGYSGITQGTFDEFGINAGDPDFVSELRAIGVFTGQYRAGMVPSESEIDEILNRAFGAELQGGENTLTREELAAKVCDAAEVDITLMQTYEAVKKFKDFGLIHAKYRGYFAYIAANTNYNEEFARPKETVTLKYLVDIMQLFEMKIFSKNGFSTEIGIVSAVYLNGTTKTTELSNGTTVQIERNRNMLYTGIAIERGNEILIVSKNSEVYIMRGTRTAGQRVVNVGGIYKGNIYIFDKRNSKLIFNNASKYNGTSFVPIGDKYSGFDAFSNFLMYENYMPFDPNEINLKILDREVIFFTAMDGDDEKIVYMHIFWN